MSKIKEFMEGNRSIVEQEDVTYFGRSLDDIKDRLVDIVKKYPEITEKTLLSWGHWRYDEPRDPDFSRNLEIIFKFDNDTKIDVNIKGDLNRNWQEGDTIEMDTRVHYYRYGHKNITIARRDKVVKLNDTGRKGFAKLFDEVERMVGEVLQE